MFARVLEKTIAGMFPDFMARHPTEAGELDEELLLMELSFASVSPPRCDGHSGCTGPAQYSVMSSAGGGAFLALLVFDRPEHQD